VHNILGENFIFRLCDAPRREDNLKCTYHPCISPITVPLISATGMRVTRRLAKSEMRLFT
jgi:hypothetical protein